MRTLVFSICARNYIGLAQVLRRSLAEQGNGADFRIYVVDGVTDEDDPAIMSAPDSLAGIISPTEYANMAFMYDVTEFCTALKAACFKHGFADGYDICLYMDPDIFLTADVTHITSALDNAEILITPHLCLPSPTEGPRSDHGILATGVYNLGFLGVRRGETSKRFLDWWDARLRHQAFNDHYRSLYTDQRWMDFVPSLFSAQAVRIWRHLGANVAPWNYHERRVIEHDANYLVRPRGSEAVEETVYPLVFLHFSGFDFRRILDGHFNQLNLSDAETHEDLLPLYVRYGDAIRKEREEMVHHLAQPYGFSRYEDGSTILPSHRRLFRIWRERHGDAADPFAAEPGSFHAALAARRLLGGTVSATELAADKATARSVKNLPGLMRYAQIAFRLLFRLVGRTRFIFLIRSLNRLSHIEQHYDTFRLDSFAVRQPPRSTGTSR